MKLRSKGFKREVVSLVAVMAILITYIPLRGSPWAVYVAMSTGYTIAVFGLVWSDGMLRRLSDGNARPVGNVIQVHLAFLALVCGWIWFAQFIKPALPQWVVVAGGDHWSWFLVFALLGIVGMLIAELGWLASMPRPQVERPYNQSFQ